MNESVASFLTSLDKGDFVSAIACLDRIITVGDVDEFSTLLERVIEWDGGLSQYQLKIRDCFAEYLGFGAVYFALLQSSCDIFRMVLGATSRRDAQDLLAETLIDLAQKDDPQVDLSFLEIDAMIDTPYVILIPYMLSKRATELETCKIPYSHYSSGKQKKLRYCLTELQQTHYGRKILSAFKFDSDYLVIGKTDFQKLQETLQSFGCDVSSMLVEVTEKDWPYSILERMRVLEQEYMVSDELWLLYRTYGAMIRLGSDDDGIRSESLKKIESTATKFCNDALIPIVANGPTALRMDAIRLMEKTYDFSKIDFLCSLIPETTLTLKKTLLRAISVIESAQYFIPIGTPAPLPKTKVAKDDRSPEMAANYIAALNQLSKSSSTYARIDAVRALSAIRIPGVENHLRRLMNDEDPKVRLAVLDACRDLPKEQVSNIVRLGLQDIDASVENKALRLFEERWPDSYW